MGDSANVRRDYIFPNGTSIAANGYLVLSDLGKTNPPADAGNRLYAGFNIPWDESRGGSVALVDPNGVGKDYVDWRNAENVESSQPVRSVPYGTTFIGTVQGPASTTAGHSLARNSASQDTNTGADWEATSGANASSPTFGSLNAPTAPDDDADGLYNFCETTSPGDLGAPGATVTNTLSADTDGDGLLDGEENGLGCTSNRLVAALTSPRDRDTDGDGWMDGLEVRYPSVFRNGPTVADTGFVDADGDGVPSVLDPDDANADTDGDGYGDAYELAVGTNPDDASSFPPLGNVNGDVGGSGQPVVDVADILDLSNSGVGLTAITVPANADLNFDGVVDVNDVLLLANFSIGAATLPSYAD
jgi:hypothetical protein